MDLRRIDLTWLALLVATFATWLIGDMEQRTPAAPVAAMLAVGVITFFKGRAVALHFMGLRGVKVTWRALLIGWLILVLGLVALAYWLGLRA